MLAESPLPALVPIVMPNSPETLEFTIDELAQASGVSVRNIRAYRNHGLLPAPEKRGRYGIYTELHLARLETISSLLQRGYPISNIKELIEAWQSGRSIDSVLGIDAMLRQPFPDESPQHFNLSDLKEKFGRQLTPKLIKRAVSMGLVRPRGRQFVANRPRIIEAGAALTRFGIPLSDLLDVLDSIRPDLDLAASHIIDSLDRGQAQQEAPTTDNLANLIGDIRELIDTALLSELSEAMEIAVKRRYGDAMSLGQRRR